MKTNDQIAAEILSPLASSVPIISRFVILRQACLPQLSRVFAKLDPDPIKTAHKTYSFVSKGINCILSNGLNDQAIKILASGKRYHADLNVSQRDFSASMAILVTSIENWIQRVQRRTISSEESRILADFFHRVGIETGIYGLPRESLAGYRELLSDYVSKIEGAASEDSRILFRGIREWDFKNRGRIVPLLEFWLFQSLLDKRSLEMLGIGSTVKAPKRLIQHALRLANAHAK